MQSVNDLVESARRWSQAGLEAFTRSTEPHDFAVHHVAVGVEHLLKGYLTSLHPALIVDARHFDSLLHATGQADRAKLPASRIKTIGLMEAFEKARLLLKPGITPDKAEFQPVADARNGVAHIGLHDDGQVRRILQTCVRVADPVLENLAVEPKRFWGEFESLRENLIDERTDAVQLTYEGKRIAAERRFRVRMEGLNAAQQRNVVTALGAAGTRHWRGPHEEEYACPVCAGLGRLAGETEVDWDWQEQTEDNPEAETSPLVQFFPSNFDCPVCGLALDGVDELAAAGLPDVISLPDADPLEYAIVEPDWESYYDHREKDW